jgi:hypothetical protein
MADFGRKDFTEQVSNPTARHDPYTTIKEADKFYEQAREAITPDSQKSTLDKTKDTVTGKADDIAGAVQPEGQKSTTQKIGDSAKDTFNQGTEQVSLRPIILT